MKCHHHPLLHTDARTVSFPHCTQALIYKPAEHEIQLFNHRLLVHNPPMMRAIHFTGSRRPVKRGEMHRVGPLNEPLLHVHVSVYLKSKLGRRQRLQCVKIHGGDCRERRSCQVQSLSHTQTHTLTMGTGRVTTSDNLHCHSVFHDIYQVNDLSLFFT